VNRAALTVSRRNFGKEKGAVMKFATVSKSIVVGLALLLASSAFAGTKSSLQLSNSVTLNGTTLKPGTYKVQWEGSGPNVEVSILQGKNVVAKAAAHLVQLQAPSSEDAAVTRKNASGPNSLAGLRFEGKKFALDLDQATDEMQTGSSK
jgi:siroheme synthase